MVMVLWPWGEVEAEVEGNAQIIEGARVAVFDRE
jgi:hypothetical protein